MQNLTNLELENLFQQVKAEINFRNQYLDVTDKIKIQPTYDLAIYDTLNPLHQTQS